MSKALSHTLAKREPQTNRRLHTPIAPVTIEPADDAVILRTAMRASHGMTEVSIAVGKRDFAAVLAAMIAVDRKATLEALLRHRSE